MLLLRSTSLPGYLWPADSADDQLLLPLLLLCV
jgi:hypothetical protein